jgi:hypothetical protein
LASAVEVSHHPLARIVAQVPERFARVAVFEVVAPDAQEGVEVINYFGRQFVALA